MTKVLVVYCSMSGNTRAAAEVVAAGAKGAGARVTPKEGSQARPQDPLECDAAAPGSHDAFSYMGGALKDFLDRAFYPTHAGSSDGQALRPRSSRTAVGEKRARASNPSLRSSS